MIQNYIGFYLYCSHGWHSGSVSDFVYSVVLVLSRGTCSAWTVAHGPKTQNVYFLFALLGILRSKQIHSKITFWQRSMGAEPGTKLPIGLGWNLVEYEVSTL